MEILPVERAFGRVEKASELRMEFKLTVAGRAVNVCERRTRRGSKGSISLEMASEKAQLGNNL